MVTIAHLVEREVSQKPYLQEALLRGLINYGALADEILPKIEEDFQKKIKHSAVMMALRRLSEKLEEKSPKSFKFKGDISFTIKSDLFNISYKKSPKTHKAIQQLYEKIDSASGDFLAVNVGNHEVSIISSKKNRELIKKVMKEEIHSLETRNVAAITLNLSLELMKTPGFFYLVTRAMTWDSINISEVVSTPTELTLIVNEKDVMNTYNILKKLFG